MNSKAIRLFFLLIAVMFLISCQKDEKPKNIKRASISDSKLYKVSKPAAFIKLNLDISQKTSCMLSKKIESTKTQNKETKSGLLLKSMQEENENLCNFYTTTLKVVSPVFENIENSGFVPKESFVLTVIGYSYDRDDELKKVYEEDIIGLFNSLDSCETVKKLAQKFNIPNKGCKQWMK